MRGREHVCRPAFELESLHRPPAGGVEPIRGQIAGGHRYVRTDASEAVARPRGARCSRRRRRPLAARPSGRRARERRPSHRSHVPSLLRLRLRPDRRRRRRPARTRASPRRPRARPNRSPRRGGSLARGRREARCSARVVGCAPVPNARPGSTTTAVSPTGALDPRRTDPDAAGTHRPVELLPAIFPAGRDRLRARAGERAAERDLPGVVRVHGELCPVVAPELLETRGRVLEEQCARDLEVGRVDEDRDALEVAQRSALFSRRKKPSFSSGVGVRLGAEAAIELLDQATLLVVERRRHRDVEADVERPAAATAQRGHAVALQDTHLARLRAGRDLELDRSPRSRRRTSSSRALRRSS